MPQISTLIYDIQQLLQQKDGWFTQQTGRELGEVLSQRFQDQFKETQGKAGLRLSRMGPSCPCALWHSIHHPELAEPLPPWAIFKYRYGDIIEAFAITLAKAAGHEVTGEQDELVVDGIVGHRDCVIDGCLVDVKSTSSRGYLKFKDGTIRTEDSFGYLDQLDGYLLGSADDPLVRVKDRAYLLAIDKQLGHMCLYEHTLRADRIKERISDSKQVIAASSAPGCTCGTSPDGKSGNIKLDVRASYSPFKYCCHPHLRTFLYASGPVYLTHVARKPAVPEITKDGRYVY